MNGIWKRLRQLLAILFVFSLFNDTFTVEVLGPGSLKIIALSFFLVNAPALLRMDLRRCRYAYLFFAAIFLSVVINLAGYENLVRPLSVLFSLVLIVMICSQDDLDLYTKSLWGSVLFSIVLCLLGNRTVPDWGFRRTGGTGDPNEFSAQVLCFLFAGMYLTVKIRKIEYTLISLPLSISGLIYAGSKSALLAVFPLLFAVGVVRFRAAAFRISRRALQCVFLLAVVVSVFLLSNFRSQLSLKADAFIDRFSSHETASYRFDVWRAGIHMGASRLWGAGFGRFPDLSPAYAEGELPEHTRAAHNIFVATFAEAGVLGLVLLGLLLLDVFLRFFRHPSASSEAWLGLQFLALVVMGLSLTTLSDKYFWFSYAICINGLSFPFHASVKHNKPLPKECGP